MKVHILPENIIKTMKVAYIIHIVFLLIAIVWGFFANPKAVIIFFGLGIFCFLYIAMFLFLYKKSLYYCKINNDSIKSYTFFGKELYTLDTQKPVYYVLFMPGAYECVALSNQKIECGEIEAEYSPKEFFKYYDDTKLLVLPYNSATRKFLKLDEWIKN